MPKKETKAKKESAENLPAAEIDGQMIAEVISSWTGIPLGKMMSKDIQTTLTLEDQLKERIKGQSLAVHQIAEQLMLSGAQLQDPNKPRGVFLLVGSSGIGKTETALALADLLYGSEEKLITINMSEFSEAHKVSTLIGSPPGYVGFGEGGLLTEAVRRQPYSVILLDELEKAHPSLQDLFYQALDKGILMDSEGQMVNFKNTLILMTSNAASHELFQWHEKNKNPEKTPLEQVIQAVRPALLRSFKPAFLGRVTVIPYLPLDQNILEQIIQQKLGKIQRRVEERYRTKLDYPKSVLEHLSNLCQRSDVGARYIDAILNRDVLPLVSRTLLTAELDQKPIKKLQLKVDAKGNWTAKASG